MFRTVLASSLAVGLVSGVASSDVLMTFDFGFSEADGGTPFDGSYGGSVELLVYGVDAVGDMVGEYQVELLVDYSPAYDMFDFPLVHAGTAIANRHYQDDGGDMIWDMGITFNVGGTMFPYGGTSYIGFADVVALDPDDPNDTYSYGFPRWETFGDDGSGGLFHIDYPSITETVVPAPAALAIFGLAGLMGSSRRRR